MERSNFHPFLACDGNVEVLKRIEEIRTSPLIKVNLRLRSVLELYPAKDDSMDLLTFTGADILRLINKLRPDTNFDSGGFPLRQGSDRGESSIDRDSTDSCCCCHTRNDITTMSSNMQYYWSSWSLYLIAVSLSVHRNKEGTRKGEKEY